MNKKNTKLMLRNRRKKRVRKKIFGNGEKPRLCVHKSNRYIYAQLIDDEKGVTLLFCSSLKYREDGKNSKSVKIAEKLGEEIGKRAVNRRIKQLVFDRSGYPYHGRIKALVNAIRKQGIKF